MASKTRPMCRSGPLVGPAIRVLLMYGMCKAGALVLPILGHYFFRNTSIQSYRDLFVKGAFPFHLSNTGKLIINFSFFITYLLFAVGLTKTFACINVQYLFFMLRIEN